MPDVARHPPLVLALGDVDAPDLAPARDWLDRHIPATAIRRAESLREVRRLKDEGVWHPDLIVVFQTWSDQFSGVDAHALFAWFPFARVVCCHGPWCESDGRTRVQWPLAVRVPATLAAARLDLEREFLEEPDRRAPPPPLTANRGDLFGAARGLAVPDLSGVLVAVDSPDRALSDLWSLWVRAAGGSVATAATNVDSLIFDADPWPSRQPRLAETANVVSPERIVALVGFRHRAAESEIAALARGGLVDKLAPVEMMLERIVRSRSATVQLHHPQVAE